MTLDSTTSRVQYTQAGSTTEWPVTFKFLDEEDLIVITTVDDVDTTLTLDTDYSVTGAGDDEGGTVTISPAVAAGTLVTIYRQIDLDQQTRLTVAGGWYPTVHEAVFDRLTMQIQQVQEQADRSLKLSVTDTRDPEDIVDDIFEARDDAQAAAASAEDAATRAEVAATTAAYYGHEGTLSSGEDTITLPWAYDTSVGVEVYLSGVKQAASALDFTDAYTVTLDTTVSADTDYEVVSSVGSRSGLDTMLAASGGSALVGFLQSGTGATARTAQAKGREWVTPEDYGGDVQKALDASRVVALHAGTTYEVEDTVTIGDNQILLGFGATIKRKTGSGVYDVLANEDQVSGNTGIVIRDLKIDGNKDADSLVATTEAHRFSGISLVGVANGEVSGCHISGTVNAEAHGGIWVEDCTDTHIIRNRVTRNDRSGIVYFGGARNVFSENHCYSNTGSGITGGNCPDAQFSGNHCYSNGSGGTYTGLNASCTRARVIGNLSYSNTGSGITLGEAAYVTDGSVCVGNTCYSNTLDGISAQYSDNALIENNNCYGNARHNIRVWNGSDDCAVIGNNASGSTGGQGIYVDDGDRHRIIGNRCHGNGFAGVYIDATASDGICSGNVCTDNGAVTSANSAGILANTVDGWLIKGNQCFDTQGTPTQESGIWMAGGSGNSLEGNRCYPNKTYSIRETSSPSYSRDNNKIGSDPLLGAFTVGNNTTYTVSNNNASAVAKTKVWPLNPAAIAKPAYVSSVVAGTSFTVTLPSAGSSTETYGYEIE